MKNPVPTQAAEVTIARAWPGGVTDGVRRVSFEGRDAAGALRAGVLVGDQTRLLDAGADPKLPALGQVAGELLVHRPGKRAVVRTLDGFVKILRRGRAADVAERTAVGHELAVRAGLGAPAVIGSDDATVRLSVLPGRALHDLAADPGWGAAWRAWRATWPALARSGTVPLPTHSAAAEADVVSGWVDKAVAHEVLPSSPWTALANQTAGRLRALPELTPLLAHRDLHDKQLLWDGTHLGVLDFDTAALADPALDLTNLAVHARLRVAQGLWPADAAAVAEASAREVADQLGVTSQRWHAYWRGVLVRLAAVYAFRPRWAEEIPAWALRQLG